jgi:ComF family protein
VRCGEAVDPAFSPAAATICRVCRLAPPPFVRAVSYGAYEYRMRDAIHALKYDRLHPLAPRLGRMLALAISQLAADAPADMLVIPVPLHRSKHAQRGFNQARSLATHAIDALCALHPGWRLTLAPSAVIRLRATESQARLTPRQRRANVRGAFMIADPRSVAGKHILVIDDIFTTGATVRSVARELRRAGAASVWAATLARARWNNDQHGHTPATHTLANKAAGDADPAFETIDSTRVPPAVSPADNPQPASMGSSTNQPSF